MFTTVDQFFNDFRIKNNQFPNETVLNRGPMRLKREIRELKSLVDCLLGKEIEPWHEDKVYEIDEYVSYNGIVYRSNLDSNIAMNPQTSGFWDQQDIESVKSKNHTFKYIEFVSDGVNRKYNVPFQMNSTPAVFADGRLLSPTKFTWTSGYVELNSPVGNQKLVTVIAGLSYETVTVQPKQIFVAENQQWHFETTFQLSSPAVFKDGLYLTSGFIYGSNFVDFDEPVADGSTICIVNGTQGGIDIYSKQDIDALLGRYYTKDDVYTKAEVDSEISNTKNSVLNDPSLAKQSETYTKLEVDNMISSIDVSDQINSALSNKADKATSLAGYGIVDAYDQNTIDIKLQDKLNAIDFNAANILDKIRDAEGSGTGLNADTLQGLRPEQFVRRDRDEYITSSLEIKDRDEDISLNLNSNGDVNLTKALNDSNSISYSYMNELNAKGSMVIIEGDFKGIWWDDIRNFGILEPELYNWVVEVRPLFVGRQFDYVPKEYGDGLTFTAWKEKEVTGSFFYGLIDGGVVKLYSFCKLANETTQDVTAHYVIKGYHKSVSVKFNRNQNDAAIKTSGFTWNPDTQQMSSWPVDIPEITRPDILSNNSLEIITNDVLHEDDNVDNVKQTEHSKHHTLRWFGFGTMKPGVDYWITVTGGVSNQAVEIKIANGSIITAPADFDPLGNLNICIRGLDPLEYAPTITVDSDRCNQLIITPAI